MIGPTQGFDVNGRSYKIDTCSKHFIVVNGTYDRPTNMLHNIGHRVEATMRYLTQNWINADRQKYWDQFASIEKYNGQVVSGVTCGNAHFPFNASQDYAYDNKNVQTNNCSDWKNFPNLKNTQESYGCDKWGCTDEGWQERWLGSIPKNTGETQMTSRSGKKINFPNNWWNLLLSPDLAIAKHGEID